MRHTGETPLLVHPDLLGSVAGVGALDKIVYEGTGCEDERMLGKDERSGACTREHDRDVLGCIYGGIGLVAGSCGIIIEEGIGDRGARGEASEERSIDQLER